jgi:hypothetical protein
MRQEPGRTAAGRLVVLLALVLALIAGCAPFRYERRQATPPAETPRTGLRVGVFRLAEPPDPRLYLIRFGNTLADPAGDLSRGLSVALRDSGLVADAVYLGAPTGDPRDLEHYRSVYGLDAILEGRVTRWYVTSVPELWSVATPLIVLWPLHVLGLPTAPCHDSAGLDAELRLTPLAAGAEPWRSGTVRFAWHEHNWYSSLTVPRIERSLQTHAMDHFVTSLVDTLRTAPLPASPAAAGQPSGAEAPVR